MGFFDIFKGKPAPSKSGAKSTTERPKPQSKEVARYADSITKRAQTYDRQEAIDQLSKQATTEAAAALLKRFNFVIEPSITDQEEKESAFRGCVSVGEQALPAIREFCTRAEGLTWPLRMMRELLDEEAYVTEVLALLAKWDTEYDRNADPKVQLLATLEEHKDPRVRAAVERFLDDVHEPTRFHVVSTLLAQDDPSVAAALAKAMLKEEAVRTQNRIAEGLAARGWPLPEDARAAVSQRISRGFVVDGDGIVRRR
ncbi:MAG: HEAT repeat domain-containing protein [Polyangiales bacterium]